VAYICEWQCASDKPLRGLQMKAWRMGGLHHGTAARLHRPSTEDSQPDLLRGEAAGAHRLPVTEILHA